MKSLIKITFALALTSMLFFSCSKDDTVANTEKKVKITLTANKDGISTKTAAVEGETSASYIWTSEDASNIKLYTVSGGSLTEVQNPTVTKVSDKELTISAEVAEGSYTFRAILAANYTTAGNPKVPATQTPNGTSNYDPNADVLVSDDLAVVVGDEGATGDLNLKFHRKAVVNKMTLKNMTAGEKVSKVVISSDKDLTGYLDSDSMVGDGNTITLNYSNVAVPADGQFPVYFISSDNSGQTVTVEVTTDKSVYTKTFGPLNIVLGKFTRIGVKFPKTATILFGESPRTQIDDFSVTGNDTEDNIWEVTTVGSHGYLSFTQNREYSQIGTDSESATSISFTTSLPASSKVTKMSITLGGTYDNSADVHLAVGDTNIGSGHFTSNKVTINSTAEASGKDLTITINNIWGGVRVYSITVTYE